MSVDIRNTEFEIENYKVYIGPNRMIDPSSGYVFFMCEPKEGKEITFLGILKTKKGDIVYPEVNEHHAGLINALMLKANEILDPTQAMNNTELDSDVLVSETKKFVEQDLNPTNDDETVLNFDFTGFLGSVGDAIKKGAEQVGDAIKKGAEQVGEGIKHGVEAAGNAIINAGEKVFTAGKAAIDIAQALGNTRNFRKHMDDFNDDLNKLGINPKKEED